MKLYFYFLEEPYNKEPYIRCEECEVEEKPKTYKPVDKFPNGYWYSTVKKDDIGKINGYQGNIVVLTEKDNEKVADIFKSKFECSINRSVERIKREEENIDKQKSLIEMVERWKSE